MKNVELAYAITVHSSQGCEFPCCIFPVSSSYGPMLTKPLYYTGITRAKKKLVMIGDEEALKKAVRTTRTQGRKSLLGPRIPFWMVPPFLFVRRTLQIYESKTVAPICELRIIDIVELMGWVP